MKDIAPVISLILIIIVIIALGCTIYQDYHMDGWNSPIYEFMGIKLGESFFVACIGIFFILLFFIFCVCIALGTLAGGW